MRVTGAVVLMALASCGGGDSPPQLVDGSQAAELPAELADLDDAVLTRSSILPASDVDGEELLACSPPPLSGNTSGIERITRVIERTGVRGSSLTFAAPPSLYACDKIPDPITAEDPDRPYDGIWCGAATGRLDDGVLNDPRLDICADTDGELTGFAWVEPQPATKWVVVSDAGTEEIYEVAESLPVRVTTTDGVQPESSRASFDVEEYGADGTKLREYVLEAAVAG